MRILGLDFGEHTVGVAVSDESGLIAQKVETIQRKFPDKLRQTLARIEELVSSYGVDKIILGYPKNMNNTEGERCEKTREFQALLERRSRLDGITIELWDERLTTAAAERVLIESGVRRENRKQYVDQIAAVLILQGYLDFRNRKKERAAGYGEDHIYGS
ncbi:MAG: Holliday junction resolvase RuvX [Eubacterium sp.]|nr:Holliday junction resolvase RuvX [Eubacterium sp.]